MMLCAVHQVGLNFGHLDLTHGSSTTQKPCLCKLVTDWTLIHYLLKYQQFPFVKKKHKKL